MAILSTRNAVRFGLPIGASAVGNSDGDYLTEGANLISNLAFQSDRIANRKIATKTATEITEKAATSIASKSLAPALEAGSLIAKRGAVLALPVAGEAIGATMIAIDVTKLGYRAVTGKNFDDTKVGHAILEAEDGTVRFASKAVGGALDAMHMTTAANLSRSALSIFLSGKTEDPATEPKQLPRGQKPSPDRTIVMTPGPSRPVSENDYAEKPLKIDPTQKLSVSVPSSPLSRAEAIMTAFTDDANIPREDRINYKGLAKAPQQEKTQTAARQTRSSGLDI